MGVAVLERVFMSSFDALPGKEVTAASSWS